MAQPIRKLAENPWFWLALFGGVGMLGVLVIAPKFAARMARVERMQETRERVAQERSRRIAEWDSRKEGTGSSRAGAPRSTSTGGGNPSVAAIEPEPYEEGDFQASSSLQYLLLLLTVAMLAGTTGLLISRGRERRAAELAASQHIAADSNPAT